MRRYFYLTTTPESLVASMLPPEEFGTYLAIGSRKASHGQAVFFDLKEGFQSDEIDLSSVDQRCVPRADGQPKHSLYLAIYRVLERVPLEMLNSLWLVTTSGAVLERKQSDVLPAFADNYYLYQEVCPVHPLIASSLAPPQFSCFITDPRKPIFVPRVCFVDLNLGEMATDAERGHPRDLYYPDHFYHLRNCLLELKTRAAKHTKTVDRRHPQHFPYHCIRNGFYVGDQKGLAYYPFPSLEELEGKYFSWWRRSAQR
jgi:hypothetical protein